MFSFSESWPAAIAGVVIVIASITLGVWAGDGIFRRLLNGVIGLVISYVVVTALVITCSWMINNEDRNTETVSTGTYPIQSFGMSSGQEYPLILGSSSYAAQLEVEAGASLFGSYFLLSQTAGSASTISFEHDGLTYWLDIPASVTTFVRTYEVEPSVSLIFKQEVYPNREAWNFRDDLMLELTTTTTYDREGCILEFVNFFWSCSGSDVYAKSVTTESISDVQLRQGLAPWVNAYLESAVITLTPEMYDQLTGAIPTQ